MNERHTTFYIKDFNTVNFCGKPAIIQMDLNGAYELPFATTSTEGTHDYNSCEGCQNTHKVLIKRLSIKFNGTEKKKAFPFCCEYHSNLLKVKEFKRASFIFVPKLVADKIIFTNQHITNNHQKDDYYEEITDYIKYTVQSFGQMPSNCGEPLYLSDYFYYVKNLLNQFSEIEKEKKTNILEFIERISLPSKKKKNTDLNILISIYEKWFKLFPFEISYFEHLKSHYTKNLLFIAGKDFRRNKYSGSLTSEVHSKKSLIDFLLQQTKDLLSSINVTQLRNSGEIQEIEAKQLEFADAELIAKTAEITRQFSKGELKYLKALKKWLQLNKDYFKEVTPLLKGLPPQQKKTKAEILKEQLNQFGFFELERVTILTDQNKISLTEKISKSGLPYAIAMFDYLQFIQSLEKEYFDSKYKLNREVSKWFNSDREGRSVKGNISSLSKNTTENKDRYTAYKHKEKVIKYYEQLK